MDLETQAGLRWAAIIARDTSRNSVVPPSPSSSSLQTPSPHPLRRCVSPKPQSRNLEAQVPGSCFWLCFPVVRLGFPCGSAGRESACHAGDLGSIPALGRSPGAGKSYPLQYSGLENSTDCIVHGVANSRTQMSAFHFLVVRALRSFGKNS